MTQKTQTITDSLAKRAAQVQRGGARAAVLGVNDGLVSTLCIVIAVAATGASAQAVLVAGFAGLLAGAISMAVGEWISVRAQVELFEGVLADIKNALQSDPKTLKNDLIKNLEGRGIHPKTAADAVDDVAADEKQLMSMYSSQVIGVNEDELGSPWVAAFSSFALFTAGSIPPLSPWIFGMHDFPGIALAIALTGLGSLIVGGYTARSSGKSMAYGAIRQLIIVVIASAITYGIGHAFGVATGV